MTRKPEGNFRRSVNQYLKGTIYTWSIHDSFTSGVPDAFYSGAKSALWVEYKYYQVDRQFFDLTKPEKTPKLTRLQQAWLNSRYEEGRSVAVIVGMPSGGVMLRNKDWMRPQLISTKNPLKSPKDLAIQILEICR